MSVKIPVGTTESINRVISPTFSLRALNPQAGGYCVDFFYYNMYQHNAKGDRLRAYVHVVNGPTDDRPGIIIGTLRYSYYTLNVAVISKLFPQIKSLFFKY